MSTVIAKFCCRVISASQGHSTGAVFLFHGAGCTGDGFREGLKLITGAEFCFPHLKVIYPTAPLRPSTPLGGMLSNIWFDRKSVSPTAPEDPSLHDCCKNISEVIKAEIQSGIPENRLIFGGFSQGGCLALHLAYRLFPNIAGVAAFSSGLHEGSIVYKVLERKKTASLPPLLQFHGKMDDIVLHEWGEKTHKILKEQGVETELESHSDLPHAINEKEMRRFREWVLDILPEH